MLYSFQTTSKTQIPKMFRYIFHISDLHMISKSIVNIRSSLNLLIEEIKKYKVDQSMLVIVGDIFDKHSSIEQDIFELFMDMCDMLESNKICTLIMPGNHDYNTETDEIYDWPVLILKKLKYKYIKAYNKSCIVDGEVFNDNNIQFYLWMPNKTDLPKPQSNNKIKIALIHEPINAAVYDNGTKITGGRFSVDDLRGFDYVMLGDIHKPQFLAPRIAYSGSFVQKHIGEGLDHGCIIWDLNTGKGIHKYFPLKQLYVTTKRNKDGEWVLPDLDQSQKIIHLRYDETNCDRNAIKLLKDSFKKKYNTKNIPRMEPMNRMQQLCLNQIDLDQIDLDQIDLDQKVMLDHSEFLTEVLKELKQEHMAEKIIDYHKKSLSPCMGHSRYKLNYLVWRNATCYRNDINYIDFRNIKNNIVLINGKNEAGKSTVIDILATALFDKHSRGTKKDLVSVKKQKQSEPNPPCNIKLSFTIDNTEYIIDRVIYSESNSDGYKLVKKTDQGMVDITQKPVTALYKFIADTLGIGTLQMFMNMTAATQHRKYLTDLDGAVDSRPLDKILSIIINADDIQRALTEADNRRREINKRICGDEHMLATLDKYNEEELAKLESSVKDLAYKKDEFKNTYTSFMDIKFKLLEKRIPVPNLHYKLTDKIEQLTQILSEGWQSPAGETLQQEELTSLEAEIKYLESIIGSGLNKSTMLKEKIDRILNDMQITCSLSEALTQINSSILDKGRPAGSPQPEYICKINTPQVELSEEQIEKIKNQITKLRSQITSISSNKKCMTPPSKPNDLEKYEQYKKIISDGLPNYDKMSKELKSLRTQADKLKQDSSGFLFSEECACCKSNRQHILNFETLHKSRIQELTLKLSSREQTVQEYTHALARVKAIDEFEIAEHAYQNKLIEDKIKKLEEKISHNEFVREQNKIFRENIKIKKANEKILNQIKLYNYATEVKPLLEELERVKEAEKKYKQKYAFYTYAKTYFERKHLLEIQEKINFNKKIEDEINQIDEKLKEVNKSLEEIEQKYDKAKSKRDEYSRNYKQKIEIGEKIRDDIEERDFLELYCKCIQGNKRNQDLKQYLYAYACRVLEKKCNNILRLITDFTIKINYTSNELQMTIHQDGQEKNSKMISGYQKFVVDFILRIIMLKLTPSSHPNILFIDEGFGALDEENFIKVSSILHRLKNNLDGIVIITHIPELKSYVDKVIDIQRIQGSSNIKFGNLTDDEKKFIKSSELKQAHEELADIRRTLAADFHDRKSDLGGLKQLIYKDVNTEVKYISDDELAYCIKNMPVKATTKKISEQNKEKIKKFIEENGDLYKILVRYNVSSRAYICTAACCGFNKFPSEARIVGHITLKPESSLHKKHLNSILDLIP